MTWKARQCLGFMFGILLPLALQAAPGDRSATFGTVGIARDGGVAFADGGERVLAQPDGKVVMVGFRRALSGADTNRKVSVWRFNPDASRDTSFGPGGSGQATVEVSGAADEVGAAALQPDGKILVAGSRIHPSINGGKPFWLVTRLTAAGDLDVGFGGSGSRDYVVDANATLQKIESIALQSDGSILLGGHPNALMRITAGGVPDTTFGSNGIVRPPFNAAVTGIAVQADGKILVSGDVSGASSGAAVMRLNADGTSDTSFATGGQFLLPGMIAKGVAMQPAGGILFSFSDNPNGGSAFFALRLLGDGTRDTAFGAGGLASFAAVASIYHGMANRVPVAADGSFALGGYSPVNGFALARFAANGQTHPSFAGYQGAPFGGLGSAFDVALKDDGKALLVGYAALSTTDAMVVQIDTAGNLDATFNDLASPVRGIAAAGLDCAGNTFPGGIAASPNGGVYVAYGGGCANGNLTLTRLDAGGQTDISFSGGVTAGLSTFFFAGNATTSRAIAVQPDGSVVVGGSVNPAGTRDFALARVNPSGLPDASFGAGGKLVFSPSGGADELYALAVQVDGKILAAGSAGNDGVVVRFNTNGTLDATFSGGVVLIAGARVNVLALQADGAILAGVSLAAGGSAVYRLLASGATDAAFGVNGSVTTPEDFGAQGLAVLSDGAVVAAGANWIRKWSSAGVPRGFSALSPQAVFAMTATAGDRVLMLVPSGTGGATLRRLLASGGEDTGFASNNVLAGLVNPGAMGMAVQGTSVFVAGAKVDGYVPVVIVDNQVTSTPAGPQEFQLDVLKNGGGRVAGASIDCGAICSAAFNSGTTVTLTATPSQNYTFTGWTGACENTTGPCVIQMTAARTVTANFVGQQFLLAVGFSSTGNGTVAIAPPGISCNTECQSSYAVDTVVTLSATPLAGSRFVGWSGDCINTTGSCTVTMNRANLVVARFDEIPILTIARTGTGGGTVSSSPAGIACGDNCSFEFTFDTEVTLTAIADSGSAFNGWSGACSGFGACSVTMNRARDVSANFIAGTASFSVSGPPEPHNFSAVSGALSAPRSFVMTNTGNLTLIGISAVVSPNEFVWLAGTSCGTTLAPGESCNINVTLAPPPGTTAVQVISQFHVQTANGGSSADTTVAGVVVLPTVSVSPASLNFITQPGTTSVTQTLTFTAVDGALRNVATAIANTVFQKTADTCNVSFLGKGQSCSVTVTYSPTALGGNAGTVDLSTSANFGASTGRTTLASPSVSGTVASQVWTITPTAGPNGSISPSGPTQVSHGSALALNIQADSGYEASIAYVGDSCRGTTYDLGGGRYLYATIGSLADCSISVTFAPFPNRVLTVGPSAGGTVTSAPPGINCTAGAGTCSASFPHGTVVTVIPTPTANFVVGGYAGCPVFAGTGNCVFTINANTFMNVGFTQVAVNLNVVKAGLGSGTVTSVSSSAIDCGSTCTATVPYGPNFRLSAVPAPGSIFRGFTGAGCSGGSTTCDVQTGDDRTITATFDREESTFTVTNTNGSGEGSFANVLSTIYNAGSDFCLPGVKTIAFNIPAATDPGCNAATGVCSIPMPNTPSEQNIRCGNLIIDGYTQPGAAPNTASDRTNNAQIKIELGANLTGNFAGAIAIGRATTHPFGNITANNVTIRGIAFPRHSLLLRTGNSGSVPHGGSGHVVAGNVFGWHADGTPAVAPVSDGIHLYGGYLSSSAIGGPNPADRNMLTNPSSANALGIRGDGAANNLIEGNYINIDRNGTPVAAAGMTGIRVWQDNGNNTPPSINNVIRRNVIVTSNSGPVFTGTGGGNTVSENIMFGHPTGIPGINFFSSTSGGTNPQLAPVVTSVTVTGTETVVTGTVAADAMGMVRLEFFDNPAAYDGGAGRAQVFSGNLVVTADASGQATFSKSLPASVRHVAVTATRLSSGDTSYFSNYVAPTIPLTVTLTINKTGGGAGTVSGSGINCGPTCTAPVAVGSTITLTATPLSGSTFSGWSGDCTGTGSCALSMTVNRNVTANFHSDTPVFTVTNTNPGGAGSFMGALGTIYDSVNNVCAGGIKTVNFNIPAATDPGCNPATGICVLNVPEQFDIRCSDVVVDGYTQPGAAPNTATDETNNAQIRIEFGGAGGTVPRSVSIGRAQKHSFGNLAAVNVVLRGLALPHHRLDIAPENSGTVLGGGSGHVVSGNMIGFHADRTRATGMLSQGISLFGNYLTSIRIGGPVPADRNMIASADPFSGQGNISAKGVADSIFEGNYINIGHDGVAISPSGSDYGIEISGNSSNGMPFSRNNIVRRNVVANTGNVPVFTAGGAGNTVSENLMFGHPAHLGGINFYAPSSGGSNPQLAPVVTSVTVSGTETVVTGTVAADAMGMVRLEFFDNPAPYAGGAGRAQVFSGSLVVTTDASGQATFSKSLPASARHIAVTATRLSSGDTSYFSNYVAPILPPPVSLSVVGAGAMLGTVTGGGINCGATCEAMVPAGSTVTLTATTAPGALFLGWSTGIPQACPDAPLTCTVTITTNTAIYALFVLPSSGPLRAVLNGPIVQSRGVPIVLDGTLSTSSAGTIVSYEFGLEEKPAGTHLFDTPVVQSMPKLTVTPDKPGLHRFRMKVTDSAGNVSLSNVIPTIILDDYPPTALLDAPAVGSVGNPVQLSGSRSFDLYGDAIGFYQWTATQRPAGATAFGTSVMNGSPTLSFTPDVAGVWVVTLKVFDSGFIPSASVSATINVTVADTTPPVAQISASPSPALQGSTVTLSAAGSSDPNGGSIVQYRWSVLARPSGSTAFSSPATTSAPTFNFTPDRGGTWRLGLVAVDAAGNLSAQAATNLIVRIPDTTAPIAIIDGPERASAGQTVTLSGAASADLAGGIVEYRWSFSASSGASLQTSALISTSPTLTVTSLTAGAFTIRLIVVDGAGNQSASYSHRLIYGDQSAPVAVLTATPLPVVVGNTLVLSGEDSFDVGGTGLTAYVFTVASAPVGSMYTAGQLIPRRSSSGPGFALADFIPDVPGAWRFKLVVRDGVHALSAPAILFVPVLANGKPTAIIDGPEAGKINIPIAFNGSASAGSAPGQAIVKYIWTLTRVASRSTLPRNVPVVTSSPVFSLKPDKLGRYTVKLEVQDAGGSDSQPTFADVKISDTDQPVAVFDIKPAPAFVDEDTTLDGSESFDVGGSGLQRVAYTFLEVPPDSIGRTVTPPDPIGRVASIENRDGTIDYRDVRATFKPDRPGLWRIQLTARDGVGLTSVPEIIELPVLTRGQPTAVVRGPGSGQINAPIALDGSASDGGGSAIVRYRWRMRTAPFDSNLRDTTVNTTDPAFTFTPDKRGVYMVAMRIELANGQNSEETLKRIQIASAGVPVAVLDVTPSPGRAGQPVTLSGKESFSNDGYVLDRYIFTVVERPAGSTVFASPIGTDKDAVAFVPDKAGVWKFQLTVLDSLHTTSDPVEASLAVFADVPAAPLNLVATPGENRATIAFDAAVDNGAAITSYTVTCESAGATTRSATGTVSPITVAGLINDRTYACRVVASNSVGAGPASAPVNVTPVEPFGLDDVVSRKTHGTVGEFDLVIDHTEPIAGNVTVESRTKGTTHTIVFRFNQPVLAVGSASVKGPQGQNVGTFSIDPTGNEVAVTLAGIADRSRVIVRLNDVNGKIDVSAALGFMVGDVNSSRTINALDLSAVKARSGQVANSNNFRLDINASGSITSADVLVIKARNGLALP